MSLQTIEIAIPSDLLQQIDAEVGPDHRSEFLTKLAEDAVRKCPAPQSLVPQVEEYAAKTPSNSRFKPVPVRGEPISDTISRDRGNL